MNKSIIHRSAAILNGAFFLILSIAFIYIQIAVTKNNSVFNPSFFSYFYSQEKFYIYYGIISLAAIYKVNNIGKYLLLIMIFIVSSKSIILLLTNFNKLNLILLFIYFVLSFFIYNYLSKELLQPYYVANIDDDYLFDPMLKKIKCKLINKNQTHEGFLTNWGELGCFVSLNTKIGLVGKNTVVQILFEDKEFRLLGKIVCYNKDMNNIGIKMNHLEKNNSWLELMKLFDCRGLIPEYLK